MFENWSASTDEEVVFLAYERFADHVIANMLLDTHLDADNPEHAFQEGGSLEFLYKKPRRVTYGLLEAMSIQIPERTGQELVDLAPTLFDHYSTGRAFSESIIWRSLGAFSENTMAVLRDLEKRGHDTGFFGHGSDCIDCPRTSVEC